MLRDLWRQAHAVQEVGVARVQAKVIEREPPFNKW
jgi:hypothetical protein